MLSCARKTGENKKPRQTITTRRFMGAKAGNLNRLIENQDSDLNCNGFVAHNDMPQGSCVQNLRSCNFASLQKNRQIEDLP